MKLRNIKKQMQKGFTMIELVIVIAILGILAAFALPRFSDFTLQANTSTPRAVAGSLTAAMGIVKAKFIAQGGTGTTVDLNGQSIPVTSNGDLDMSRINSTTLCNNVLTGLLSHKSGFTATSYSATPDPACYISDTKLKWLVALKSNTAYET